MQKVTAEELQSIAKSKREIYNFVTIDLQAYLPKYHEVTLFHIKDIMKRKKKVRKYCKLFNDFSMV